MRKLQAKCKQCRREGIKLMLKGDRCMLPKCAMIKRGYPPGQHGIKGRSKPTAYGEQLREKQKAKKTYGILEKQFALYYKEAIRRKGDASENLTQLLEMRLDNIIYRLGFAQSRNQAKQMVSHNLFLVNNKKANIISYQIKVGDIITLRDKSKKLKLFANLADTLNKSKGQVPNWLSIDIDSLTAKILTTPKKGEIAETNFDIKAIIEFYSR
ncbi:MAG: 30S ribosomal protein S4 [Patescibacteria group bacterium]